MSELASHLPPEQEEQMKQLEQQLLAAAAEHDQAAQDPAGRNKAATRPEGPPENSSHDGVISVGEEQPVETTGQKPVVTQRQRGGAYRPQGPAKQSGVMGGRFAEVQQTEYKNGVNHVYGVDENGKKQHLSFDAVLEAYGHAGDTQGKRPASEAAAEPQSETSTEEVDAIREQYKDYDAEALAREARSAHSSGDETLRDKLEQVALDKVAKYVVDGKMTQEQYGVIKDDMRNFILTPEAETAPDVDAEPDEAEPAARPLFADEVAAEATPEAAENAEAEILEEVSEPVTDTSEQGMKARMSRIWGKVKDAAMYRSIRAQNAAGAAVADRLSSEEQSERSKRRGIYAGIAAGALILGTYVAWKQGYLDGLPLIGDSKGSGSGDSVKEVVKPPRGGGGGEHHLTSETLNVRPGEGFEDSFQHQYNLTDAQSHDLFERLRPELKGSDGTYLQGGDIRISSPGAFQYSEQERQIIDEYLKSIGKKS